MIHPQLRALLLNAAERPGNDDRRGVLADWYEEVGNPETADSIRRRIPMKLETLFQGRVSLSDVRDAIAYYIFPTWRKVYMGRHGERGGSFAIVNAPANRCEFVISDAIVNFANRDDDSIDHSEHWYMLRVCIKSGRYDGSLRPVVNIMGARMPYSQIHRLQPVGLDFENIEVGIRESDGGAMYATRVIVRSGDTIHWAKAVDWLPSINIDTGAVFDHHRKYYPALPEPTLAFCREVFVADFGGSSLSMAELNRLVNIRLQSLADAEGWVKLDARTRDKLGAPDMWVRREDYWPDDPIPAPTVTAPTVPSTGAVE